MIKPNTKSKLTLWISEDIKAFGRSWSERHEESLSQLFTDFLQRLRKSEKISVDIPPIIKKISSVIKTRKYSTKDYKKHLDEKYF